MSEDFDADVKRHAKDAEAILAAFLAWENAITDANVDADALMNAHTHLVFSIGCAGAQGVISLLIGLRCGIQEL